MAGQPKTRAKKKAKEAIKRAQTRLRVKRENEIKELNEKLMKSKNKNEIDEILKEKKLREISLNGVGNEIENLWRNENYCTKHISEITEEEVIRALRRSHGIIACACRILGIQRYVMNEWVAKNKKLANIIAEEKDNLLDISEARLYECIARGEPWAITYSLSTIGKKRGYTREIRPEQNKGKIIEAIDNMIDGEIEEC